MDASNVLAPDTKATRTNPTEQPSLDRSLVPAVERALDLIELLGESNYGLTLSEIALKLHAPKSSVHRIIYVLENYGYLQRIFNRRRYVLGMRAFESAYVPTAEFQLRMVALPHAKKLAKTVGMTVLMAGLRGREAVIILRVSSPYDKYSGAWIGHHLDLYCTALGKALIAHYSEAELKKTFQGIVFGAYTSNTKCSLEDLRIDLAEVRVRGFAINDDEYMTGRRSVAAPIFNHIGRVSASICICGPLSRFPISRVPVYGSELALTAQEISRLL